MEQHGLPVSSSGVSIHSKLTSASDSAIEDPSGDLLMQTGASYDA